ncbi:hypothetical protein ACIRBX_11015 [Kitasatospora sp. NPDC096147]|uniref:hypothetical protein n=1 Tax=Kitasatospora sp. NPDC096147 TaxID=3364093 RepID=UPI0037F4ECF2
MMPNRPTTLRVPSALLGDADLGSLDALVTSSRRLGLFWPAGTLQPEPARPARGPVKVPAGTRELVAGMSEYGS